MTASIQAYASSSERLFFEDFPSGAEFDLGTISLSSDDIMRFAREFDPQPFHIDENAAVASPFRGLIASGWHTASLFMRLYVESLLRRSECLGSPGVDALRWHRPIRPGDILRARLVVERAEPSMRKPEQGTIWPRCELVNGNGEIVFSMVLITLLARRGGTSCV